MKNKGYKVTDWIFWFSDNTKKNLNKILNNEKNKELGEEFITWKFITVFLPLLTFLFVYLLNILTKDICNIQNYYTFFNNGSLPIISFGILTSGMPYLLEQLEDYPDFQSVRRRVMALALFFLFLSASIYIIQTLSIITSNLDSKMNIILIILSIYVFLFSSSIGYKMFLLQTKNIQSFDDAIEEKVKANINALDDLP